MAKKINEIPVQKNEKVEVEIVDLSHEGLGVAKINGYPLFIENALKGEVCNVLVVKVGKKFGYAKVLERLKESPYRVQVADEQLIRTGVAPLMHLEYNEQLKFKQNQVKNVMTRLAKMPEVPVLETIGMNHPFAYRNKAQIPVREAEGVLETGFFRKNTHNLVPMEDFYIQDPKIDQAIIVIRDICRKLHLKPYNEEQNTGEVRHIIVRRGHYTGEMMVILVTRKAKFFQKEVFVKLVSEALPEVVSIVQNVNSEKTNVIMGRENKVLFGKGVIVDQLLGNSFEISPQSFYQVNTEMAETLYQTAIDFAELQPADVVIDAYCGIGTIGQSIASNVSHVYGVEIVEAAVDDARKNAERNGLSNCTYEAGKAEEVMPKWVKEGITPNVIIVDPARKGLDASFITSSAAVQPEKIVYVSCNPSTFARDATLYAELGYTLEKVQPVDLFPQTHHVETVALLARRETTKEA